jgi:hypothetical protein
LFHVLLLATQLLHVLRAPLFLLIALLFLPQQHLYLLLSQQVLPLQLKLRMLLLSLLF